MIVLPARWNLENAPISFLTNIPRPLPGIESNSDLCPVPAVGAVVCDGTIGGIITSGAQTERLGDARAWRLTSPAGSGQIHGYLLHYA